MKKCMYLLLVSILFIGCNVKDDGSFEPSLPEATLIGANTFGCYANGILITPRDGSGSFNTEDRGLRKFKNGPFSEIHWDEIRVHDFASEKTSRLTIHFTMLDTLGVYNYIIGNSNCFEGGFAIESNNVQCRIFDFDEGIYKTYCSIANTGFINVTRYDNNILSGTFYCDAYNINNENDKIIIREGRFDINKTTLLNAKFP